MIYHVYDYIFIKCVFRWSENSVRFENLMEMGFVSQCEVTGTYAYRRNLLQVSQAIQERAKV